MPDKLKKDPEDPRNGPGTPWRAQPRPGIARNLVAKWPRAGSDPVAYKFRINDFDSASH